MLFILGWDCIGLVVVASAENQAAVGCLLAPTRGTDRPSRLSAIRADRTGRLSNQWFVHIGEPGPPTEFSLLSTA